MSELGGRTVNYTYDDLYRLTNETIANDPNGINGSVGYNYDPVAIRLSRTSSVTGVPLQSSTYDANDRLTSDTYDANGNTTASNSNSYEYDFENRLTSLNNGAATFVYDGDGNRVSKTVGGVSINYLVDSWFAKREDPLAYINRIFDKYGLRVHLSGKEIVYAGQRVGLSGGVRPNQSEMIKIYEEGVSLGERHLVTTLVEEIHHSKLLSKRPDLGGQQYDELWKRSSSPEPRDMRKLTPRD